MPTIPETSLVDFVLEGAGGRAHHLALIDGVTGETLTYAELRDAVDSVAATLHRSGVGPGDTVALVAPNQPRWVAALYGIMEAGAAAVPINPALTAGEIIKLLRLARARMVIADPSPAATRAAEAVGAGLMSLDGVSATPAPTTWHAAAIDGAPKSGEPPVDPSLRPAVIAFSSGTTGPPKGVTLTHTNLVATVVQHEAMYHVGPDDRFLAALPFFHIYGLSMVLDFGLRHGATIVTLPRFDLRRYLDLIERHQVTWLHIAPPIVLQLISEAAAAADLSSVRHVVSGAAPLDQGVADRARRRLGVPVGQGYGMTEASPGVTWVPDDGSVDCPPGSVGILVAGTEARVVDPASGEDCSGRGELWVRGPQVMAGYLGDAGATALAVVEDGWLRTGDMARVDDDGVWWIVDRLKEVIKVSGFQVAPAELEALLLEHPAVEDVAVTGIPDPVAGEIPKAWVVGAPSLSGDELMAWVADRVAGYKRIRVVEFVDQIPKSPSGKILRRQLVARRTPTG